jgi:hypothetical protein
MSKRRVSSLSRLLTSVMAIAIAAMVIPIGPAQALAAPAPFVLSASPSPVGVLKGTLLAAAPTAAPAAAPNVSVTLTNNSGSTRTVKVEVVADAAAKTHVQAWLLDSTSTWYNSIVDGFGPANGFTVPDGYNGTNDFYVMGDKVGTYSATLTLEDATTDEVLATTSITAVVGEVVPVYRYYNTRTGSHFYTLNQAEVAGMNFYWYDGIAYTVNTADPANSAPLYRYFNRLNGSHFYTLNQAEVAGNPIFSYDGIAYKVCPTAVSGATPLYRYFNRRNGSHFYTLNQAEVAGNPNFSYDGIGFYLAP